MKRFLIAASVVGMMCGSAFAQSGTGPAAQSGNEKPGATGTMDKGSMSKESGTTGQNSNAARDNPNGSPGSAPMAHGGPGGDASKKESAPK